MTEPTTVRNVKLRLMCAFFASIRIIFCTYFLWKINILGSDFLETANEEEYKIIVRMSVIVISISIFINFCYCCLLINGSMLENKKRIETYLTQHLVNVFLLVFTFNIYCCLIGLIELYFYSCARLLYKNLHPVAPQENATKASENTTLEPDNASSSQLQYKSCESDAQPHSDTTKSIVIELEKMPLPSHDIGNENDTQPQDMLSETAVDNDTKPPNCETRLKTDP